MAQGQVDFSFCWHKVNGNQLHCPPSPHLRVGWPPGRCFLVAPSWSPHFALHPYPLQQPSLWRQTKEHDLILLETRPGDGQAAFSQQVHERIMKDKWWWRSLRWIQISQIGKENPIAGIGFTHSDLSLICAFPLILQPRIKQTKNPPKNKTYLYGRITERMTQI